MSSESSPQADSPKAVDLAGSDILAAARQASRSGFVFGAVLVCHEPAEDHADERPKRPRRDGHKAAAQTVSYKMSGPLPRGRLHTSPFSRLTAISSAPSSSTLAEK